MPPLGQLLFSTGKKERFKTASAAAQEFKQTRSGAKLLMIAQDIQRIYSNISMDMKSVIARWGNSLALRLPKEAIERANLHDGDEVTIIEDGGRLILDPLARVDLDALIAQMSPETFHDDPFAAAPVVGAEIW